MSRPFSVFGLMREYVFPQRRLVAQLVAAVLVATGFGLVAPLAVARYVADAEGRRPITELTLLGAAFIALTAGRAVLAVATDHVGERLAWRATNALRRRMVAHALWLPVSGTSADTAGTMQERVEADVVRLERAFSQLYVQLAASALLACGMLAVVAFAAPVVGGVVAAYLAAAAFVLAHTQRRATRFMSHALELSTGMLAVVAEGATASDELRINGGDQWIVARFVARVLALLPVRVRSNRAAYSIWTSSSAVNAAGVTVALLVGIIFGGAGGVSLATIFLVLQYLDTIRQPLEAVRVELQTLPEASAAATRVGEFLGRPAFRTGDWVGGWPNGTAIDVRDVTFGYTAETPAAPVLREITLSVPAGGSLAVVGRTGSGKTTLLRLLLGYEQPGRGQVSIGGRSPMAVPPRQRWTHIAAVTQRPSMLRASLRDNLTMFDASVPDSALQEALGRLGMADWCRKRGIDTMIEAPDDVSSGEAQLIGLVRAVFRNPSVLLLDEISARLDEATEALLVTAMAQLTRECTTVIVTHHQALFRGCDSAVLLADGAVRATADLRDLPPSQVTALWEKWQAEL